jgi:N6-L-threonylcarbamoyladenine synthase
LLVGHNIGKGLAYSLDKAFIPVNHIEGHIYSGFLMEEKPEYPYLCLVVSGGHTLLLLVQDDMNIVKLGTTIDDAVGEAFDKVSKLLGLGYPGGPAIQDYASRGNPDSIDFPISRLKKKYDFSFSGIKTAVLRYVQSNYNDKRIPEKDLTDIAAAFQKAVVSALLQKVETAIAEYEAKSISLVGGVAANLYLRENLQNLADKYSMKVVIPDIDFCGDNAAMIANRAAMLVRNGKSSNFNANAYASLQSDVFKKSLDQS